MNRTAIAVAIVALFLSLGVAAQSAPLPRYEPRAGRARPLIAVLGDNAATETTDYVVPYGILAEAGVADVIALSTEAGPIQLRPALRIGAQATVAAFDARFPDAADYVIVPNIYEGAAKPAVLDWVRAQSRRGATIVGICDGVVVLANAGLLDGRQATAHWRSIDGLEEKHPGTRWLRNRRYVADGRIITTSGVSASIPISLALIEAIGGTERARAVAARLHLDEWSATHDSSRFHVGKRVVATALLNQWRRNEELGIAVAPGVDEIALALVADSFSRTMRSHAVSVARSAAPVETRNGLLLFPDRQGGEGKAGVMLPPLDQLPPIPTLQSTLEAIEARYGKSTAALVALQIEFPWPLAP
ncbi:MAG TPA: DJ-1/PfpI family protein [Thermoanaerobaculia bacterium]|jgi:putative intracellular protease/amidase